MSWHVLQEREPCSRIAKGAEHLGPEVARVVPALPLPGDGERLARVPRCDHVDVPAKRAAVEVLQVTAPDRCRIQDLVLHPCQEDGRSVGIPLTVAHHSGWDGKSDTFVQPSDS